MAKKIVIFILGYFVWLGLVMFVGMNFLNSALTDKVSPFNDTTGPIVFLIGALIIFGGPIVIFLLWFYHTPKWEKDLQISGTLAKAVVLEVKDTGIRTGGSRARNSGTPWWRVKLQVQPAGDSPFEVVMEKSANKLFMVQQGNTINVKYDPNNKKHVVIIQPEGQSFSASGFSYPTSNASYMQNGSQSRRDTTQQLLELVTLHQKGELTDVEFEAAKKKILA
ncbi:MAG: SHOCT domain-containing protein [Anaerolineae bacterium]|nr:SHOCT domain-containing protein [Anaerolineae bacterium]